MKKSIFILATAALVLASCNNDVKIAENKTLGNEPQEITFTGVASSAKRIAPVNRAAVEGAVFNTADNFDVVAYLAEGGDANVATAGDFFPKTNFVYQAATTWHGNPARYWPFSTSTLNFLAVTNKAGNVEGKITNYFGTGATSSAEGSATWASYAVSVLANNQDYNQADLMYAAGQGRSIQTNNTLTYGNNVSLVFQHALASINFKVKTSTDVSGVVDIAANPLVLSDNTKPAIIINSITLNGAKYNGTYTISNTAGTGNGYDGNDYVGGYNKLATDNVTEAQWKNLVGVWSNTTSQNPTQLVPKADHSAAQEKQALTSTYATYGGSLLVIPDGDADKDAEGFTINYTIIQGNGTNTNATTFVYTYTFSDLEKTWKQRKKYTFNIDVTLTEILVTPTVTDWGTEEDIYVDVPETKLAYNSNGIFNIGNAAGVYSFAVTGLSSGATVTASKSSGDLAITDVTVSPGTVPSTGIVVISFKAPAWTEDKTAVITLNDGSSDYTFTVSQTDVAP